MAFRSLLELSNLPDLSSKGKLASKYLSELFNPSLSTLPDFNKELGGDAVQKAWEVSGKAGCHWHETTRGRLG